MDTRRVQRLEGLLRARSWLLVVLLVGAGAGSLAGLAWFAPRLGALAGLGTIGALALGVRRRATRAAFYRERWRRAVPDPAAGALIAGLGVDGLEVRRVRGAPNAFLLTHGLVVTDGLLALEPELVRAVLAHELAHHRNGDLAIMRVSEVPLEAVGLALERSVRGFAFGVALTLSGALVPLGLLAGAGVCWRRGSEHRADLGAVLALGSGRELGEALLRCVPAGRLGSHPSHAERLAVLELAAAVCSERHTPPRS